MTGVTLVLVLTKSNNMIEALITLLLALGLSFSTTQSGKISVDAKTMETLRQDEKVRSQISVDQLNDIVVTDDDDPMNKYKD